MRRKELLFGVNPKCAQCTQDCRQFLQINIWYCPNFISVVSNKERDIPCEHKKDA